jgi:hypothetical protein
MRHSTEHVAGNASLISIEHDQGLLQARARLVKVLVMWFFRALERIGKQRYEIPDATILGD